jgi:hypothetical protein
LDLSAIPLEGFRLLPSIDACEIHPLAEAYLRKALTFSRKFLLDRDMKTKTIALSLGLILVAGALCAADPFEGTWKLNESKSKLTRGTGENTKVVYDTRLIRDKMTVTGDGVHADGKPVHIEWKEDSTAKITQ